MQQHSHHRDNLDKETSSASSPIPHFEGLFSLLPLYVNEAKEDIAHINTALESGKTDEIRFAAHRLKGSSRMFSFDSLADACESLEQADGKREVVEQLISNVHVAFMAVLQKVSSHSS